MEVDYLSFDQYWKQLYDQKDKLNELYSSYWNQYSDFETWQFWLVCALLVAPLILVYFAVDRKRIFEIFFFGYTVHFCWMYIDIALGRNGYFVHTYFLMPSIPNATNMTASVLPVGFLLIYQYCTNHKKNFYLYSLLLSAVFAFGFASIEKYLGLVEFRKGMTQFYIFLFDIGIVYLSYWFTKFVFKLKADVSS
jgi:hypothetical protein